MSNILKSIYTPSDKIIVRNSLLNLEDLIAFFSQEIAREGLILFYENKISEEALFVGSPDLYEQLQLYKSGHILNKKKNIRLELALFKYLSRMCTRCTPFGLFATCSLGSLAKYTMYEPNNLSAISLHYRLDMDVLCRIYFKLLLDSDFRKQIKFKRNTSLYRIGDTFRYIEYNLAANGNRKHKVIQVESSEHLEVVLDSAITSSSIDNLVSKLARDGISQGEAVDFIHELVQNQILISEIDPNLSGDEYLVLLISALKEIGHLDQFRDTLVQIDELLSNHNGLNSMNIFTQVAQKIETLGIPYDSKTMIQVDSWRQNIEDKIGDNISADVLKAASVMFRLNEKNPQFDVFDSFKNRFLERYESQFIPLTEVLDPEIGISASSRHNYNPIEAPYYANNNGPARPRQLNGIDEYKLDIYDRAISQNLKRVELNLSTITTSEFDKTALSRLPDSAYSLARVYCNNDIDFNSGKYLLHFTGLNGPSAVNLLSRFCYMDSDLNSTVFELVRKEEGLNPDVIYAEVVHLPESRVGNVLKRPQMRSFEIPYLCNSTLPEDRTILIDDLLVGVRNNEVILLSKRLNKQIIPRVSNAHNFFYSTQPIYKFLCEMQFQRSISLAWDWGGLESRPFLPRVTFDNLVFSRARWLITFDELKDFSSIMENDSSNGLVDFFRKRDIPKYVYYKVGDNELFLDTDNLLCLRLIFTEAKKSKSLTLVESLEADFPLTQTQNTRWPKGEMLFTYTMNEVVKNSSNPVRPSFPRLPNNELTRYFNPGSEWHYIKLYCGHRTAEQLLSNELNYFCNSLEEDKLIEKYFFLRYTDPEHHIRLRLFSRDEDRDWHKVQIRLNTLLAKYLDAHIITKMQLDMYQREIERYGSNTITESETLFYINSKSVLQYLSKFNGEVLESNRWKVAIKVTDTYLSTFGLCAQEKMNFTKERRDSYFSHLALFPNQRKTISKKYFGCRAEIEKIMKTEETSEFAIHFGLNCFDFNSTEYLNTSGRILQNLKESPQIGLRDWLSSYIHMFCNRLFPSNQISHEAIMYEYLFKYYSEQLAREGLKSASSEFQELNLDILDIQ